MAASSTTMTTSKNGQFKSELAQFYRNKGQIGIREKHLTPRLDGQEINLWDLCSAVLDLGGSFKVNHHGLWNEVYLRVFGRRSSGVNTSVALRQIYQRYLLPYEKIHCAHFANDIVDDDDDDIVTTMGTRGSFQSSSSSKPDPSMSFVIHSSFSSQHYQQQHQFMSSSSPFFHHQQTNNSNQSIGPDPVSKLCCSLQSGLTNEVDFGLRILQVLINRRQFDLMSDFRFIDILLDCCSINVCFCDLKKDDEEDALSHRKSSSQSFPSSSPSKCLYSKSPFKFNPLTSSVKREEIKSSSSKTCHCFQRFWNHSSTDPSALDMIFDDDIEGGDIPDGEIVDKVSTKVKRIADMIRSITEYMHETRESQVSDDGSDLTPQALLDSTSAPLTLVKFIALLISSKDLEMRSIGLDIASNVTLYGQLSRDQRLYTSLTTFICGKLISIIFEDNDLDGVTRSLRTLGHLISASDEFVRVFVESFDSTLLTRMIELLTCQHDVLLVVLTLELMWSISEVKAKLLLSSPHSHLIKVLLNLLNVDVSSHFSGEALRKIRMVDLRVKNIIYTNQGHQQRIVAANPSLAASLSSNPKATPTAQGITIVNVSESENFLINWLKNNYDVLLTGAANASVKSPSLNDLYTNYVKYSCSNGRRNVVEAQSFVVVLKRVFPSVTLNGQQVNGIMPRQVTNSGQTTLRKIVPASSSITNVSQQPGIVQQAPNASTMVVVSTQASSSPSKVGTPTTTPVTAVSPILKAHLCAPPKATTSPMTTTSSSSQDLSPTSTIAPTTTTTSSLIKNLLANKLRNNTVTTKLDFSEPTSVETATETIVPVATATATIVKSEPTNTVTVTPITPAPILSNPPTRLPTATASISTSGTVPNPVISVSTTNGPTSLMISTSTPSMTTSSVISNVQPTIVTSVPQSVLISTPATTNAAGQTVAPQQFLLVRTFVPGTNGQPGQTQLIGVPSSGITGSGIRLILPPSVLTQQRPIQNVVNVNGVVGAPNPVLTLNCPSPQVTNINTAAAPAPTSTTVNSTASNNNNDILLKAVLGSGITSETEPAKNSVKSSPLLNVLLDKGKLPDNVSPVNSQAGATPPSSNTPGTPQKVFILTKSPVGLKTSPENPAISLKNGISPEKVVNNLFTNDKVSEPLTNGIDVCLEKSDICQKVLPPNDLSPIKDIQKAMDDATKLVKRSSEETKATTTPPKKIKTESPTPKDGPVSVTPPKAVTVTPTKTATIPAALNGDVVVSTGSATDGPIMNGPIGPPVIKIPQTTEPTKLEFICEWNGCKQSFPEAKMVFKHVYETHVFKDCTARTAPPNVLSKCEWGGPDGMGPGCQSERPKLSLLTHLQDYHCNPTLLKETAEARLKLGAAPNVNLCLSQPPPAHPGYAKNAAIVAIRRHLVNYMEPVPTMPSTTTTPITVSIRLTAALILRSLASVSNDVRRCLQRHERFLSEICIIAGRDEGRTIAQCLAIVQSQGWKR